MKTLAKIMMVFFLLVAAGVLSACAPKTALVESFGVTPAHLNVHYNVGHYHVLAGKFAPGLTLTADSDADWISLTLPQNALTPLHVLVTLDINMSPDWRTGRVTFRSSAGDEAVLVVT